MKTKVETKFGHAHLKVRNLKNAITFYTTFLGLEITEIVAEQYAFLTDGAMHHTIALQQIGEHASTPDRSSTGLYHIAFEVPTKHSFAQILAELQHGGVQVGTVDHLISWAMYFTDPDGNGLEVYTDTRHEPDGQRLWKGVNSPITEEALQPALEG